MKLRTLISLIFVSLIALQVGHDAIPHHHHSGNHVSDQEEGYDSDCCDKDLITKSPHHSDYHCHAFNDVHYFRTRIIVGLQEDLPEVDIFSDNTGARLSIVENHQIFSPGEENFFGKSDFVNDSYSLRGPPSGA